MKRLLALALIAGSAGASAATIEAANGDWSALPLLERQGRQQVSTTTIERVHAIVAEAKCDLPGQTARRVSMTVPFAVQYGSDGTPSRVIIKRQNCEALESVLGGAVLQLVQSGEYKPTGENDYGWSRGEISFSSRS